MEPSIFQSAIDPNNFFHVNELTLLVFGPGFFLSDVAPFQSKEVECFFGPWMTIQENWV